MITNSMRPLPPDILIERRLSTLPVEVRWTAIGLRMYADDHGREVLDPHLLRSAIWPGDPHITTSMVEDHVLELDAVGYVVIYDAAGETLFALARWGKVSHADPSYYPPPPPEAFQNISRFALDRFPAVEREGESASGSAGEGVGVGPSGIDPDLFPSPFCSEHPLGTTEDCRNCGTARLRLKLVERQRRVRAKADLAEDAATHDR